MSIQLIDGTSGAGDFGFAGTAKVNANFIEVYDYAVSLKTRLKRAIASPHLRRHTSTPWKLPPAYAASTAYATGQWVVASGNLYICDTAGTSGAGSPPTGAGMAPITDGTVTWFYAGAAYAEDAAAPVVTVSATQPTTGRFFTNATNTFAHGAPNATKNDGWYNRYGYEVAVDAGGFKSTVNSPARVEVMCDDAFLIIAHAGGAANYAPIVEVDGRYVMPGVLTQAGTSGTNYYTITFPDRRPRRVVVYFGSGAGAPVRGMYVSATGLLWQPAKRPGGLRGFWIGDSFSLSYGSGESIEPGLASTAFDLLGVDDIFIDGTGGTGLVAGGASVYSAATRLDKLTAYLPDFLVVQGSVNDNAATLSTMTAGWAAEYAGIRARAPNALIIVTGVMSPSTTGELAYEGYLRQAVAATQASDSNLLYLPASGDAGGSWMTGSGRVSAPAGNGNADAYLSPDLTHPVGRGYRYLARRVHDALAKQLAA